MINKFIKSDFVKRWVAALDAFFSPGSFISLIITALSLYLSITYKENIPFSNLMAVTGSVFGGIFGAFFKDKYDKISGKNILEKKGRSALRNLQGINTQLHNIKVWVTDFSKATHQEEDKRVLNEINRHVSTIELNIASGLEDWVDIVPELQEKNLQGAEIDKKYQETVKSVVIQLLKNRKELANTKNKKIERELKKKISDLEKQVKEIKKERSESFANININPIGLDNSAYGLLKNNASSFLVGQKICLRCGKFFMPDYLSVMSPTIANYDYCENCRKNKDIE